MAHIHRKGNVRPLHRVRVALNGAVPAADIFPGDLVAQASNFAVPAASFTWTTDEATTRTNFVAAFLGVSNDRSRLGVTDSRDLLIEVHTDGYFEFDCASATYEIGTKLGPDKAAGNNLKNTVKAVTAEAEAIAVVTEHQVSTGRVTGKLVNTVLDRVSI
jgi:hypothetical protein